LAALRRFFPRERRLRRWRPIERGIPEPLKALLGILVVATILWGVSGYLERVRRTQEAPITILLIDAHHDPGKGASGGISIRYRYVVDGITRDVTAIRSWSLADVKEAKVCYDPSDPANHALARAEEACG
jgi:hypothetical protein